ncbi:MAG: septum formation protein Maf [Chloroflexi bacterium]|nr:septum formation protein Maf [Chloroflexota bacterium]
MFSLILGSMSPRRRALLALLGLPFVVQVADVDEDIITDPDPIRNVQQRAELKGRALAAVSPPDALIIAADTTVAIEGEMLNKPADAAEARQMLGRLRGRWHEVHTGMVLVQGERCVAVVDTTAVRMRDYSTAEIEAYIATGDPFDKAGAYAIQHPLFAPVAELQGCYLGVMGLSICQLRPLLAEFGLVASTDLGTLTAAHEGFGCPRLG